METRDPLFELYVQLHNPRTTEMKTLPTYYNKTADTVNAGYLEYTKKKDALFQKEIREGERLPWDTCEYDWDSSEEDDDADFGINKQKWAWDDDDQLANIQLDTVTIRKRYVKLTVTNSTRKEDCQFFKINYENTKWPEASLTYIKVKRELERRKTITRQATLTKERDVDLDK